MNLTKKSVKFIFNHENYRDLVIKGFLYALAGKITPVIAVNSKGVRLFIYTRDKFVGRNIFINGPEEADMLCKVMGILTREDKAKDRPVFIDIGANVGSASIYAILRSGFKKAIAFEPEPANLKLLKRNLLANRISSLVEIYPIAVSDKQGTVELELSEANFGDHRVRVAESENKVDERFEESKRRTIRVPCDNLDNILAKDTIGDIGLVWIDAQGSEGKILRGASQILSTDMPVVCEFWPYGLKRAGGFEDLLDLTKRYFSFFVDLRNPDDEEGHLQPISELSDLEKRYTQISFTDILLLK